MFNLLIRLIFTAIAANCIILFPLSASTQENAENQEDSQLSSPPNTGTPEDSSSPGGTRTESERIAGCRGKKDAIASLTGNKIKELTVSDYPSFWFYIPYTSDEIDRLEFALEDTQAKRTIYQTPIQLSETGIVEVTLPQQSQYAIERNKNYTWYLKGYCNSEDVDIALSGWIRRISLDSQLQKQLETSGSQKYQVYLQNTILYDAITALAKQYQTKPENLQIKNAWSDLLDMLGLKQLANEPLLIQSTTSSPIK